MAISSIPTGQRGAGRPKGSTRRIPYEISGLNRATSQPPDLKRALADNVTAAAHEVLLDVLENYRRGVFTTTENLGILKTLLDYGLEKPGNTGQVNNVLVLENIARFIRGETPDEDLDSTRVKMSSREASPARQTEEPHKV